MDNIQLSPGDVLLRRNCHEGRSKHYEQWSFLTQLEMEGPAPPPRLKADGRVSPGVSETWLPQHSAFLFIFLSSLHISVVRILCKSYPEKYIAC